MLLKGSPLNIKVKGLCLWDGENFALSPRRLAIFLVMSSGVLQTYFFLCNGFLIQKVQRVKVISDKRQSRGHSRTHLHVKNTAECMTWAHSFRAAQEFRLNWCNSREDATPLQYCTFPISVKSSKPILLLPQKWKHETFTHKSASLFCPPGMHQMNIHQHCLAFMLGKWRMLVWIQSRNSLPSPSSGLSLCVCQSCDKHSATGWGLDMLTKE